MISIVFVVHKYIANYDLRASASERGQLQLSFALKMSTKFVLEGSVAQDLAIFPDAIRHRTLARGFVAGTPFIIYVYYYRRGREFGARTSDRGLVAVLALFFASAPFRRFRWSLFSSRVLIATNGSPLL